MLQTCFQENERVTWSVAIKQQVTKLDKGKEQVAMWSVQSLDRTQSVPVGYPGNLLPVNYRCSFLSSVSFLSFLLPFHFFLSSVSFLSSLSLSLS